MNANLRRSTVWPLRLTPIAVTLTLIALLIPAGASAHPGSRLSPPSTLTGSVLVSTPPSGATGPDDLALLSVTAAHGHQPLVWAAFQNGINPNGSPGHPGGAFQSTIAGFNPTTGQLVASMNVTGKVDGLTADPAAHELLATVNEDDNSSFYTIDPSTMTAVNFRYFPNPAVNGTGGTDSVTLWDKTIVVTHSNPLNTAQATDYAVRLSSPSHVAYLTPLFRDAAGARDALTGGWGHLALTDPDTNLVFPSVTPTYKHDLATVSQGDGLLILAHRDGHGHFQLTKLTMSDNVSGNLPPVDGVAVATKSNGMLYVVDSKTNTITALSTGSWPAGTVFVTEASDNGNPLLGTLNLSTGVITPLGNHFGGPKALLFVP